MMSQMFFAQRKNGGERAACTSGGGVQKEKEKKEKKGFGANSSDQRKGERGTPSIWRRSPPQEKEGEERGERKGKAPLLTSTKR